MRVLLFTGKGGVGKTTTAAATALHLAAAGSRVLVSSADAAHSLGDSFGAELGGTPVEVAPRCWAQQLDAREELEGSWNEIREWVMSVLDWAGVEQFEAEELAVIPGLEELFALTGLEKAVASQRYDVIIVDCAPTAETIRLLSLPDILSWYMDRLFPASRRINRMVAPVLGRVSSLPVADDSVFVAGQRFHAQLDSVRRILSDPATTSARLVLNPERMVIAEARRTFTYLSLFGYQVDGVVVNRVLPDRDSDEWYQQWRGAQQAHLRTIEESFAPLPVFLAEHRGAEVVGVEELTAYADALWGATEPAARLVRDRPITLSNDGDDVVLSIALPFAEREAVDLTRSSDELFVAVGPHRRTLALPESLRRRAIRSAALEDGRLDVCFVKSG